MPDISPRLVEGLVSRQFPQWKDLPVTPVERQGWDNRTFRLGTELVVRLPSASGYVPAVAKEASCLPLLAQHLDMRLPVPVAVGEPDHDYPFPWSVRRWLDGRPLDAAVGVEGGRLAADLGLFLRSLRGVPAHAGPYAGAHSFFRGCHPSAYGHEVQVALERLAPGLGGVAVRGCHDVWSAAMASIWTQPPVWFHGDVAAGNLLVADGALVGVIDFGTCGVGDPACDLVVAWTYLARDDRRVFRDAVALDAGTWERARGWALWKVLITLAGDPEADQLDARHRELDAILSDSVGAV